MFPIIKKIAKNFLSYVTLQSQEGKNVKLWTKLVLKNSDSNRVQANVLPLCLHSKCESKLQVLCNFSFGLHQARLFHNFYWIT